MQLLAGGPDAIVASGGEPDEPLRLVGEALPAHVIEPSGEVTEE